MRKKIFFGFLIALLVLLVPCMAFAHSGRTDSAGGHHDYQNKSGLGSYHYHHGYGPHLHPNGVCPYAEIYNTGSTGSGSSDTAQNNSSVVQPKPQKITKQAYAQVITIACTGYYWNFDLDEEAYGNDLAIWTAQTYNIDGYNYIKLRDLAYILNNTPSNFNVGYDAANNVISLTSNSNYIASGGELLNLTTSVWKTATACTSTVLVDGIKQEFMAFNIDGNNYFKLRDIAALFNFAVWYDEENYCVVIDTYQPYLG